MTVHNPPLVLQGKYAVCGQACVAMIAGRKLSEIIVLVGKNGPTFTRDLRFALQSVGWDCDPRFTAVTRPTRYTPACNFDFSILPDPCIVRMRAMIDVEDPMTGRKPKKCGRRPVMSHAMLYKGGHLYDPASGIDPELPKDHLITAYLPLRKG